MSSGQANLDDPWLDARAVEQFREPRTVACTGW